MWNKEKSVSNQFKCYFKIFYILITLLLLANFVMVLYDLQFRGYWTEKVIAWIWLTTSPVWIVLFWRNIWTKIYTAIIFILLMFSIVAMAIPFFAFVYFVGAKGDYQQIQINPQYRMEISKTGALSPVVSIEVYQVEYGIFERKILHSDYNVVLDALSIKGEFEYPHFDDVKIIRSNPNQNNIVIEYHLNGKTATVVHDGKRYNL